MNHQRESNDEREDYAYERLAPHRESLERLAELDIELSDDARRALTLLDEQEQNG